MKTQVKITLDCIVSGCGEQGHEFVGADHKSPDVAVTRALRAAREAGWTHTPYGSYCPSCSARRALCGNRVDINGIAR